MKIVVSFIYPAPLMTGRLPPIVCQRGADTVEFLRCNTPQFCDGPRVPENSVYVRTSHEYAQFKKIVRMRRSIQESLQSTIFRRNKYTRRLE